MTTMTERCQQKMTKLRATWKPMVQNNPMDLTLLTQKGMMMMTMTQAQFFL
jgi:hypothetical protein